MHLHGLTKIFMEERNEAKTDEEKFEILFNEVSRLREEMEIVKEKIISDKVKAMREENL